MTTTQNQRLLEFMRRRPVNPVIAWSVLGIYRLSARIHDLRTQGHEIESKHITIENRYREQVSVAEYTLVKEYKQQEENKQQEERKYNEYEQAALLF